MLTFDEAARHPHNVEHEVYRRVDGVLHPRPGTRPRDPVAPDGHVLNVDDVIEAWSSSPARALRRA